MNKPYFGRAIGGNAKERLTPYQATESPQEKRC